MEDEDTHHLLTLLEALKEASKDLHTHTNNLIPFLHKTYPKAAIEAILELEPKAVPILSANPALCNLSDLLRSLKTLIEQLEKYNKTYGLRSLLCREITSYKISHVAHAVESESRALIDRVCTRDFVRIMMEPENDEGKARALIEFERRLLSYGFDPDFQDLVLRAKVFNVIEHILSDPLSSKRVQERAAKAVEALVKFNKNVFVGLVLMGPTINALITMASSCSISVLSSLIRLIRTPLVDELLTNGEIPRIVELVCWEDLGVQMAALDCVLEIGFIGRKEVIEAMMNEELIKKLMELQRKMESSDEVKSRNCCNGNCVAMFSIEVEVGEGLSTEEKGEIKIFGDIVE